jgi:heme/copper-type cytochrome/quinol oxidase subunit 2
MSINKTVKSSLQAARIIGGIDIFFHLLGATMMMLTLRLFSASELANIATAAGQNSENVKISIIMTVIVSTTITILGYIFLYYSTKIRTKRWYNLSLTVFCITLFGPQIYFAITKDMNFIALVLPLIVLSLLLKKDVRKYLTEKK